MDLGTADGRRMLTALGAELREARLACGVSQQRAADGIGVSHAQISRIELGLAPRVSLIVLARFARVVGLRLSARAYPAGLPVRDAAHLRLLARFRQSLGSRCTWRTEVPLPIPGDDRAWDAMIGVPHATIGVEAETRLRDVQAVDRRIGLKQRDDARVSCALLVIADTRNNRRLVREHAAALAATFPIAPRVVLAALSTSTRPPGNGIVLV